MKTTVNPTELATWTAAIARARAEYHAHPVGICPANHHCPDRIAAKAEHAAASKRSRDRKKEA